MPEDGSPFSAENVDAASQTRRIVERAETLVSSLDVRQASVELHHLYRQWMSARSASQEDEILWRRFHAARRVVHERHKRDLIVRAEALSSSERWKQTSAEMKLLMEEWRQSGSAGMALDDEMWGSFQQARQAYFDRARLYFEALRQRTARLDRAATREGDRARRLRESVAREHERLTDFQMKARAIRPGERSEYIRRSIEKIISAIEERIRAKEHELAKTEAVLRRMARQRRRI